MSNHSFVLIPGAGGEAWYFHRLVPELEARGHEVVAVDLPAADDAAGLAAYARAVVDAVGDRSGLVVVAQSMGGLVAPLVVDRLDVRLLVLLNAMVPKPGETGGAWWEATGQAQAAAAFAAAQGRPATFDVVEDFFHDVPDEVREEVMRRGEAPQSGRPFEDPWPLHRWPGVPTRFLQAADDRLFPLEFQRRVVADRLGLPVEVLPGGHLVALSRPAELARRLHAMVADRAIARPGRAS